MRYAEDAMVVRDVRFNEDRLMAMGAWQKLRVHWGGRGAGDLRCTSCLTISPFVGYLRNKSVSSVCPTWLVATRVAKLGFLIWISNFSVFIVPLIGSTVSIGSIIGSRIQHLSGSGVCSDARP